MYDKIKEQEIKMNEEPDHRIEGGQINETPGNLFDYEKDCALAISIGADFNFYGSLTKFFQARYGTRDELRQRFPQYQWNGKGYCLVTNNNHVFNLITKSRYFEKPTLANLREALVSMRDICLTRGITKIAMPRYREIEWQEVKDIIVDVFMGFELDIRIVYLDEYIHGRIMNPDLEKQNFGKDRKSIDGNTSKKYY